MAPGGGSYLGQSDHRRLAHVALMDRCPATVFWPPSPVVYGMAAVPRTANAAKMRAARGRGPFAKLEKR